MQRYCAACDSTSYSFGIIDVHIFSGNSLSGMPQIVKLVQRVLKVGDDG